MWLLIGYGSLLHNDDRFARVVLDELEQKVADLNVELISSNQLTPEMAEPISRADSVIFVDASTELSPGEFNCKSLCAAQSHNAESTDAFTHQCSPELILGLSQALYNRAPAAWLYTVGAESLALGESLSPAVAALVPEVTELIMKRISTKVST